VQAVDSSTGSLWICPPIPVLELVQQIILESGRFFNDVMAVLSLAWLGNENNFIQALQSDPFISQYDTTIIETWVVADPLGPCPRKTKPLDPPIPALLHNLSGPTRSSFGVPAELEGLRRPMRSTRFVQSPARAALPAPAPLASDGNGFAVNNGNVPLPVHPVLSAAAIASCGVCDGTERGVEETELEG
jgi:hypothetical protein